MDSRLAIRSIPQAVMRGLEALAGRHDRSVEGEARFALRSYVEPLLSREERSARCVEVSARLRELLQAVNSARRSAPPLKPARIAAEIGEDRAGHVEGWFTGELEPSFAQLDAVADYLGGVREWLRYGDGRPFPVEYTRIPSGAEGVSWLLDVEGDTQKVDRLYLVRSANKDGNFAVVKRRGEWRCWTYSTPFHVSGETGDGGRSDLAALSVTLHLLYKYYCHRDKTGLVVTSHIIPDSDFQQLSSGRIHPLTLQFAEAGGRPWWEDFWDTSVFRVKNEDLYWPGWRRVCEDIHAAVMSNSGLREERELILQGRHPMLTQYGARRPAPADGTVGDAQG